MTTQEKKPKVLLFDIGGVCVVSPMKSILQYEKQNDIPLGYINYAISASKPNGSWHKAERGEVPLDRAWFEAFEGDLRRPATWEKYHREKKGQNQPPSTIPNINAETLFWTMMSTAQTPDPYMSPALRKLKSSNQYHIAALSNTTIFPDGHPFNNRSKDDVRNNFDIFISSAHVGMRKPDRNIYDYAMKLLREKWPEDDIQPADILFLDDIGENLRMGRSMGWRTLKVGLGRTDDAVRELERVTGLELLVGSVGSKKVAGSKL